ncbi:MAG: fibronectin type III domain protein [Parcubacteria bacterium C7867-003]|nr:MAG: fibronectin type III domain protein [Parcubacteria bacterium C7867-003]
MILFLYVLESLSVPTSTFAQSTGTVVYSNLPAPVPGNIPSLGYQCCSVSEFGDRVHLEADTPRRAGYANVLMSSWSKHSDYPTMSSAGYKHPITLAIYANDADALAHSPLTTVTQMMDIPWRPEADPTCPGGTAWRATNGSCYNGMAFVLTFDLRAQNLTLPDEFVWGVAYNTNTWGYNPLGVPGPYESLNVGTTASAPSVGIDVNPDVAYVNYSHAPFYSDLGAGGTNTFRPDTGWTGFAPSAEFTTFAIPATTSDCKNGAWQNLVRGDFTPFKNQGACVSYVNTGK